MYTFMVVLHVVFAVFAVGPMAVLPMTGLRAIRAGQAAQVSTIARGTFVLSAASLLVVIFGFGALGMAPDSWDLSIGELWIWLSIVLYAIALGLTLGLVVPALRQAAQTLQSGGEAAPGSYPRIAAASGVATLLLLAVVVLMVAKP